MPKDKSKGKSAKEKSAKSKGKDKAKSTKKDKPEKKKGKEKAEKKGKAKAKEKKGKEDKKAKSRRHSIPSRVGKRKVRKRKGGKGSDDSESVTSIESDLAELLEEPTEAQLLVLADKERKEQELRDAETQREMGMIPAPGDEVVVGFDDVNDLFVTVTTRPPTREDPPDPLRFVNRKNPHENMRAALHKLRAVSPAPDAEALIPMPAGPARSPIFQHPTPLAKSTDPRVPAENCFATDEQLRVKEELLGTHLRTTYRARFLQRAKSPPPTLGAFPVAGPAAAVPLRRPGALDANSRTGSFADAFSMIDSRLPSLTVSMGAPVSARRHSASALQTSPAPQGAPLTPGMLRTRTSSGYLGGTSRAVPPLSPVPAESRDGADESPRDTAVGWDTWRGTVESHLEAASEKRMARRERERERRVEKMTGSNVGIALPVLSLGNAFYV